MAKVQVVSADGAITIEIEQDADGFTAGHCPACGEDITDRGHYEDTVQAVQVHLDHQH